jgi:hypothetical protein
LALELFPDPLRNAIGEFVRSAVLLKMADDREEFFLCDLYRPVVPGLSPECAIYFGSHIYS